MNRTALGVGLLISVPLLVFLALGFRTDPRAVESPLLNHEAPLFELEDLDQNVVSLESLRGKPVVLNFWATWCMPCVAEHPVLVASAERWAGRAHFLGVVYHDEPAAIERFVALRGSWGSSLIDPGAEVAIRYGIFAAPETFIIDRQGVVRHKIVGAMNSQQLERMLSEIS